MIDDLIALEVFRYVRENNIDAISNWVEYDDGDVDLVDGENNSLLALALLYQHWKLAGYLIDHGADVNVQVVRADLGRVVAIVEIVMEYRRWDLVEKMIRHELDTNQPPETFSRREPINPEDGYSPSRCFTFIQIAAMYGHRDIVRYLIGHPQHQAEYADINIGLSLDLFGSRANYSAIDMNEVVNLMSPAGSDEERRNLRGDLLILQATAKYYTLTRVVPKFTENIIQRCNMYLELAQLALSVINRSIATAQPPIVQPSDRLHINRILVLQKTAFSWFCSAIAVYLRNVPNHNLQANIGLKALSYFGNIIDCAADRGYFHGHHLQRLGMGSIFDAAFENILGTIQQVNDFVANPTDQDQLRQFLATPVYKIASYMNDYEQLNKLKHTYLKFSEHDLRLGNRNTKEASLNRIAAILEIVTQHLSETSRAYVHDIDFSVLEQIRNHLLHVNGDNRQHNAFHGNSRAQRFDSLVRGDNPIFKRKLLNFMRHDLSEICSRLIAYKKHLETFKSCDDIFRRFNVENTTCTYIKNTSWSWLKYLTYIRYAKDLFNYLNQAGETSSSIESSLQHFIRTQSDIEAVQDDASLRGWCNRVRGYLGLRNRGLRGLASQQRREQIIARTAELLPIQPVDNIRTAWLMFSYIKYAANMYYAIQCLQRMIDVDADVRRLHDEMMRKATPSIFMFQEGLSADEEAEKDRIAAQDNSNNLMKFNVIEWQLVHFYEHAIEFIQTQTFLDAYRAGHGEPTQLLRDLNQIRNYVAHVANPRFAAQSGQVPEDAQIMAVVRKAPQIQAAIQQIYNDWRKLFEEVISLAPELLPEETRNAIRPVSPQNSNRHPILVVGFFAALAVVGGYYLYDREDPILPFRFGPK